MTGTDSVQLALDRAAELLYSTDSVVIYAGAG